MKDNTAATYPAPVDKLLTLGKPELGPEWRDYLALGLESEHVPDLIRMATDEELNWADSESLVVWAPVHAWRALGQLRAEAAVQPLLDLLEPEDESTENEWLHDDLPHVFGLIGPPAIPALVAFLDNPAYYALFPRAAVAGGLAQIGKQHPEARAACVAVLVRQLEAGDDDDPTFNGFLVHDLVELKAVEALPTIERAYAEEWVDDSIMGDIEDVEIALGLQTERTRPQHLRYRLVAPLDFPPVPLTGDRSGPVHAEKAARKTKRKMAERSRKLNRRKKK